MKKLLIFTAAAAVLTLSGMSYAGSGKVSEVVVTNPNDAPSAPPPEINTYYLVRWKPLPPNTALTAATSAHIASYISNSYTTYNLTSLYSPANYEGWLAFSTAACRTAFLSKRVYPSGSSTTTWSSYYEIDGARNTITISGPPNVFVMNCPL
ncbi:MAG: hypothetical protein BGO31_04800 [Bacteroidetes bacterium 43-16]|nr:MAG: hypothetical protein BGO31_04800 [Bacteroidetes bacterium 43-16]